jgi:hypothetical protein
LPPVITVNLAYSRIYYMWFWPSDVKKIRKSKEISKAKISISTCALCSSIEEEKLSVSAISLLIVLKSLYDLLSVSLLLIL